MNTAKDSGWQRYRRITTGKKNLFYQLKYELITTFIAGIPGLLGWGLRKVLYPSLLHAASQGGLVDRHVTIRCPHTIILGKGAFIEEFSSLLGNESDRPFSISVGKNSYIRSHAILDSGYPEGFIDIGEHSSIGHGVQIHGHGGVRIGHHVMVAGMTYLVASSHNHRDCNAYMIEQGFAAKGIIIEDDVWIGANVTILDGVRIGQGAIVGAGSVVNRDVGQYWIVAGVPARKLRLRKENNDKAQTVLR